MLEEYNNNIDNLTNEDKINLVKNTYNSIAKKYVDVFFEDYFDQKYIDRFLKDLSGTKILDAGCGIGRECKYVQEKGFEVLGIDFAEEIIKEAQNKFPVGNFKVMDITEMDFKEDSFDGIICINVLFNIPKSKMDGIFKSFGKILKKDGKMIMIIEEGNEERIINEPLNEGLYTYMQDYTMDFISNKLNENGLKIYDYEREIYDSENCPLKQKLIIYVTK